MKISNKLFFCLILGIVLILGGCGQAVEVGERVSQEQEPAEAGKVDTSDWQTYKNEEYGFEFKYPADWEVVVPATDIERGIVSGQVMNVAPKGESSKYTINEAFSIIIQNIDASLSFETWFANKYPKGENDLKMFIDKKMGQNDFKYNPKNYHYYLRADGRLLNIAPLESIQNDLSKLRIMEKTVSSLIVK